MFRHHRAVLALALVTAVFAGASVALAQATQAQAQPPAPTKWVPLIRGLAEIEYLQPTVRREGDVLVSTFKIKNVAQQAIGRLTIEEFWYDKAGNPVTGDKQWLKQPLKPGEVGTIVLRTPRHPAMDRSQIKFSHIYGDIKPKRVAKM